MQSRRCLLVPTFLAIAVAPAACGGDDDGGATCQTAGGPVTGVADTHCTEAQPVDQAACDPVLPDAGPGEVDAGEDGPDYGETLFGTEGDEDECKYRVTWSSTPICQNVDVTFTVNALEKVDDSAVTGAMPYIEAFLDDMHPAPNTDPNFTDKGGGTYNIGPIQFNAAGRWTVRFHFFGDCADTEGSPHGHVAFFVDVP